MTDLRPTGMLQTGAGQEHDRCEQVFMRQGAELRGWLPLEGDMVARTVHKRVCLLTCGQSLTLFL